MSGGFTPALKTVSDAVTAEASVLASEHGMVKRVGVTIDSTTVGAVDSLGNKPMKAGTIVAKITASGKFAAYSNALSDGRETAVGILTESINLKDGDVITVSVLLHGSVLEARISGLDSGARTDLAGRIIFQ